MGAWFGSIHIRTEDADAVRTAASQVATLLNAKFLVAPVIDGWVSLFPHQHGQDQRVTETLTALLPTMEIIHVVLADDDVFAYGFLRGGRIVDEYVSKPDYFERVSAAMREKQRGWPEHFAHLIAPPNTLADVQRVLDDRDGDAMRQFKEFAELLRLPNAATSYEYLVDGETDGITAFKQFVRLPDPRAERQGKREREKAIKAEIVSLQKSGVLLLDEARKKTAEAMFPPYPAMCDAPGNGFFVAWPELRNTGRNDALPVLRYGPPAWPVGGEASGIEVDAYVHSTAVSPSGRYLAIGCASGRWEAELRDLQTGRFAVIEQPRAVTALCFDPQERRLMLCSDQQLTIVSIGSGKAEQRVTIQRGAAAVAHHPSENTVLVADGFGQLLIVDPINGKIERRLLVGGPAPFTFGILEQGAERVAAMQFTSDGRLLLCAVGSGAHVYGWPAVRSAEASMPAPVYAAAADAATFDVGGITQTKAGTYDVVYDAPRHRALFCGLEGRIQSLDLATGAVADVFTIPGRPPTYRLVIARDGAAVACIEKPGMFERKPTTPPRLQIWKL